MSDRKARLLERGETAFLMGDLAAAERLCGQILSRTPGDAEALNILGAVAFSRRDFEEAEKLFRAAWSASPDNLGSLFNLGKVLETERRFEDAANVYGNILQRHAEHAETLLRLGIVRYQQGALDEAAAAFEKVLEIDPTSTTAALSLGVTYNANGHYEDSVRVLRALVARDPGLIEGYHALADSLIELRRPEEAAQAARVALVRDKNDVQALISLGLIEFESGDYAAAEREFRHAATIAPERHEPSMNLGVIDQRFGRTQSAIEHGKRAVDLAPSDPLAHFNYAMALLANGDFSAGWKEAEWRMLDEKMREHFPYRNQLPLWTGEPLEGKLLIAREQGVGDFILFSRFFADARARVAHLAIETPSELLGLYGDLEGVEVIEGRCNAADVETFTAHLPIASLPFVLGIDAKTIASRVPYLVAPSGLEREFRARISAIVGEPKVALVLGASRAFPADAIASLTDVRDVAWVPLQRADLTEMAAAFAAVDLVITLDPTAAHLTAALGKPVWLLHDFSSSLLWQPERTHSPWYPTMRIFRQSQPDGSAAVLDGVRSALGAIPRTRA